MTEKRIADFGEVKLIELIETKIHKITQKKIRKDDAFFSDLFTDEHPEEVNKLQLVSNSDMLVSTTDVPQGMNYYQIGRKAVIMNISDLIVKGVYPKWMIISMGIPERMLIKDFQELIRGIIEYGKEWNINYLGGDINETKEIIISPTVYGLKNKEKIIFRKGIRKGDYICINGKFGLTGVGLDILVKQTRFKKFMPKYQECLESVLENENLSREAFSLADLNLASASIDSSDGLAKSLKDLMRSNPGLGFKIIFNERLIAEKAAEYSKEYGVPLEELIFNGGEEFIHIFAIPPEGFEEAQKLIRENSGTLLKIGKVIDQEKILIQKEQKKRELKERGFEHFL
jgi:thiamine-monophosphate kinase